MIPMTERQFDIAHQLLMLAMIIVDSFVVRSRVPDRHREAAAVRGIQSVGRTPADAILEMVRLPREAGRGQTTAEWKRLVRVPCPPDHARVVTRLLVRTRPDM